MSIKQLEVGRGLMEEKRIEKMVEKNNTYTQHESVYSFTLCGGYDPFRLSKRHQLK
jgi:hypothetical protein